MRLHLGASKSRKLGWAVSNVLHVLGLAVHSTDVIRTVDVKFFW
jgi:hypothetical protein